MHPFRSLLILFIPLFCFTAVGYCQPLIKNYDKEWKKIDELIAKKNLPKSALAEVKKLYALAKKEKQDAQVIKAVVYMTGLQRETREENEALSIKQLEKEIAAATKPAASVLTSILAGQYWNYYENRRWNYYDRTETRLYRKDDISTWSAGDFHKKVAELYLQSIRDEKLLQQTKLTSFDAVILKGNVRHLRPTLFDLLAHRALEYFKNDERDIDKPAYAFEISQAEAFDEAADFVKVKFTTRDSASLQHKALLIYQQLIAFHLHDAKPDALLDADIQRLEFVKENSTHPDKTDLYRQALQQLTTKFGNLPAASKAWHLLAKEHYDDADQYEPFGDTTHRFAMVKAKEICEKVISQKDSSEGKINCISLLKDITRKELKFTLEKVNVPGQPFRSLVEYRNLDKIFLRLIKADDALKENLTNYYDEKNWQLLFGAKAERSWQQSLPVTSDYQKHLTEIKIDALPAGEYLLLAASDNFSKNAVAGARFFYVSNISFVNNDKDYFLLHRETGAPLPAANVQVWKLQYDSKQGKYIKQKADLYKTDDHGYFKMKTQADNNYSNGFVFDITHNKERLYMDDWMHDYYYYRNEEKEEKESFRVFYFTDRSIYRPGQTVFFKGIVVKGTKEKKNEVAAGFTSKLYLENANGENMDSIDVTANEYGSFAGKFQIPTGVLNGGFSIYDEEEYGRAEFSVEEYKRPKFYVEYEKVKGSFKVNDKIKVTGLAKAYAGNNIDGALVKFRVVREPRFIYPWLYRRWWQPPSGSMEIIHGELKTDKDGKFAIEFDAIPDKTIDKKLDPLFDYTVYADVTDINGETRSGETMITAGYKSLILSVELPSSLPADSFKTISIRTENMAGEFEPALVKVAISKLKEEKRLIRNRFWDRPDQFVMSKQEYLLQFPNDEYDNESDYNSWEKGETVSEKTDSSNQQSLFKLPSFNFLTGWYQVEIFTKDKNGEEIKDVKHIELFNESNKQLTKPQYLWTQSSKQIEPGENTEIKLGSSADNLFVIQQTDKATNLQPKAANFEFITLANEKKSIEFSATEDDRGGYRVSFFFVKHNRFFQFNEVIKIPWTNKELKIEYATFRDKTLPGSEEKWKVKISGYKKEKVAAEMLASMYDASLDQFKHHSWSNPDIWPENFLRQPWIGNNCFSSVHSTYRPVYTGDMATVEKQYDKLVTEMDNAVTYYDEEKKVYYQFSTQQGRKDEAVAMYAPALLKDEDEVSGYEKANRLKSSVGFLNATIADINFDGKTDNFDKPKTDLNNQEIQIRKNFNETSFFFPDLRTNENGDIEFSFNMPEALTKWKFQAMAHTKELAFGYSCKEIITQKQLMVQPNAPRFLREGDKMEFSAKIVNMTDKELTGQAELQLFDAATNESVSGWFRNMFPNQYFTVAAGKSDVVLFPLEVPYLFNKALTWRIVARAADISDGEEAAIPVLINRMLVTETMPINLKTPGTKKFNFEKLVNNNSETLQHHALTVEYTSNPAWYAVQALPYLMEYPYECAEQTWNRYYANALAAKIANSSPRIRQIFESWNTKDTAALLSNLQKNPELKAVLLEETPWVLQAKTEEQQKKNIALLFDMVRMSNELNSAYEKLKQMQSDGGGFTWFKGGPDNPYITQYIVSGIGHLKKLGADINKLEPILKPAILYLDRQIKKSYNDLKKYKTDLAKYTPGHYEIQYLYMRSFFKEQKIDAASQAAYNYFRSRTQLTWMKQSKYMQGMIALALFRSGDAKTPAAILRSLKESSITNEELGMYWKENSSGYYWHQAPVETQALLIEVFSEISNEARTVNDLKTWLLKNKQTNNWKTTKATAEACYALLLKGTDWLADEPVVEIKLGNTTISSAENKPEAGTGYFKKTISGPLVTPEMGNISVKISASQAPLQGDLGGWGAMYWQYFENLDMITTASTPLKLDKKLFVETNSDKGPVLTPIGENEVVKVGDKIKVRIELRVDRDMEYVHMKDMRASCMEPVNVLSGYKWQGGLGYYETTKDASTNFFFDYLRKGTYVFEYALFVTHTGNFSNGITSIQCMYAPEFSSHSEGIRINVE